MINKTKSAGQEITVIFSCYNKEKLLPSFLSNLARQTHPPDEIIGLDRNSTDRSPIILTQWQNSLNLRFEQASIEPGGEALNFLLELVNSKYVFPLELNIRLRKNYLESTGKLLNTKSDVFAAGGKHQFGGNRSGFQRAAEEICSHPLAPKKTAGLINQAQGLIYRKNLLTANKCWNKKLNYSAQIELMTRLKNEGKRILFTDKTSFTVLPPANWRRFFAMQRKKGQVIGELARYDLLPSLPFWRVDRLLTLWSFTLAWNPFGWGLILLYTFFTTSTAICRGLRCKPGWRIIYLLPLLHLGWWMGWLDCRFNLRK
ncbi:MAG: glycosyltransferase [bacterium]